MSEMKRYKVDDFRLDNPTTARTHLMVHAELFDAERLRADTAEAALAKLRERHDTVKCQRNDATKGLADAEQRISELEQHQPVKLPERKSAIDVFSTYGLGEVSGWNKCLDALGNAFGVE